MNARLATQHSCLTILTNRYELAKFASTLADVKHGIEERLQQWIEYEDTFDRIISWLNESEATLKNYGPKNTLQEKTEQLERFQVSLRFILLYFSNIFYSSRCTLTCTVCQKISVCYLKEVILSCGKQVLVKHLCINLISNFPTVLKQALPVSSL